MCLLLLVDLCPFTACLRLVSLGLALEDLVLRLVHSVALGHWRWGEWCQEVQFSREQCSVWDAVAFGIPKHF